MLIKLKKHLLFTLIIFNVLLFAVNAEGPKLQMASAIYDFGTVAEGDKVKKVFDFKNAGSLPLEIQRVVTACGCTASTLDKKRLKPGESGKIEITFNTRGFSGSKVKTVKLYTNDPDNPTTLITLRGAIQKNVQVAPPRIEFLELVKGDDYSQVKKKVSVSTRDGSGVKIRDVSTLSKDLIVEDVKTEDGYDIYVSIASTFSGLQLRERVVVRLNGAKYRSINIPVFARIKPKYEFSPKTLSFGVINKGAPLKKAVKFVNNAKSPVKLQIVESKSKVLKPKIIKLGTTNELIVSVILDANNVTKDVKEEIRVKVIPNPNSKDGVSEELAFNVFAFKE
jgi:hypothetical protein